MNNESNRIQEFKEKLQKNFDNSRVEQQQEDAVAVIPEELRKKIGEAEAQCSQIESECGQIESELKTLRFQANLVKVALKALPFWASFSFISAVCGHWGAVGLNLVVGGGVLISSYPKTRSLKDALKFK
ncbi:MAG: hypothetical protein WBB28_01515 [Crinalium sp.]